MNRISTTTTTSITAMAIQCSLLRGSNKSTMWQIPDANRATEDLGRYPERETSSNKSVPVRRTNRHRSKNEADERKHFKD
jgi:hypothetical protein